MTSLKSLYKRIYLALLSLYDAYTLPSVLTKELDSKWTILDVGCGYSSSLRSIRKGSYRVGLDFYQPYILKSKMLGIHDDYVLADARALPFKSKSFDCTVATEILEHLSKPNGTIMIKQMEEVAKKKVFLITPNGFLPTYAGPDDNPEESHISGWHADELKKLGFKVYGLDGLKLLRKVKSGKVLLRKPLIVFAFLVGITQLVVYRQPFLAFRLFCVKNC